MSNKFYIKLDMKKKKLEFCKTDAYYMECFK